jgi:hypothetical protein
MKVFISWSGERSKALANALRDWLPMVLQYVKPWVSDKDISAGDRWALSIAGELEASNFGIICITPENLNSEWVLFESGALSKSMLDAKVIPLLYGLELSDLSGPLSQFQAQKVDINGIREVVNAINKVAETKTQTEIVDRLVPSLWPSLEKCLDGIPDTKPEEKHMRPQHEILEELVSGVRGISTSLREIDPMDREVPRGVLRRRFRIHPRMIDEAHFLAREGGEPLLILPIVAGFFRQEIPWLAEVLAELYRELRDGDEDSIPVTLSRLSNVIRIASHSQNLFGDKRSSKEIMMMTREALYMVEHITRSLFADRDSADDTEAADDDTA